MILTFVQKNACIVFSFLTEVSFYFINVIYDNLIIIEVTPLGSFFIIISFIVSGLVIYFGYNQEDLFIRKIYYNIIKMVASWFILFTIYNKNITTLPSFVSEITLGLSIVCILVFILFYNRSLKKLIDREQIFLNALSPILKKKHTSFKSAKSFIIYLQRIIKISKFKIVKDNKSFTYYPFFLSPDLINEYVLVVYVLEQDITNENSKYLAITSINDKVINFNKIINLLIEHLKKNSKIQDNNILKLTPLLNKDNESTNRVFSIDSYFIFLADNNHLIPLFIKFWEDIQLQNIVNCELETNNNLNVILVLENLKSKYSIILKQFYLKGDNKTKKQQLYLFFNQYSSFQKLNLKNLENFESEDILKIYLICILNEPNLDIQIFNNCFINILKKI